MQLCIVVRNTALAHFISAPSYINCCKLGVILLWNTVHTTSCQLFKNRHTSVPLAWHIPVWKVTAIYHSAHSRVITSYSSRETCQQFFILAKSILLNIHVNKCHSLSQSKILKAATLSNLSAKSFLDSSLKCWLLHTKSLNHLGADYLMDCLLPH